MPLYDMSVSGLENYVRYCNRLKRSAKTLAIMVSPSSINSNGRMGSDQVIAEQLQAVKADVEAVEMMEQKFGVVEARID